MVIRKSSLQLVLLCLTLMSLGLLNTLSTAQTRIQVTTTPFITDFFPMLSTYLSLYDEQGNFIHGLIAQDIHVIEDGQPLEVDELTPLKQGVQVVLAINPAQSFTIRDIQGLSRFEYLVQAWQIWVNSRQGSTLDDISLLARGVPEVTHQNNPLEWLVALQNYDPALHLTTPNLDILSRAIEIASDSVPRPGMGRAIIWVTAPLEAEAALRLPEIIVRAQSAGIRVYIWLVASIEFFNSPVVAQMSSSAAQTGGQLFTYSGQETIPNLEEYLEPLRNCYYLSYTSQINTSGSHKVAVWIQTADLDITTSEQELKLDIMPPNVAFISPPLEIKRTYPQSNLETPEDFTPKSQMLEVLIEFPDSFKRDITRSVLYVDGEMAVENTSPPFDRFNWNLSEYTTSGAHKVRVEVTDMLGLSGSSIEHSIQITIERPTLDLLATVGRNRKLLAGLAVFLAGVVLVFVLLLGGRLQPRAVKMLKSTRPKIGKPLLGSQDSRVKPGSKAGSPWGDRFQWLKRHRPSQAYAILTPTGEKGEIIKAKAIPILQPVVTIGSDPKQAKVVLDNPTVEGLHARLQREADGSYRLCDEGTTAGTWVNYSPISKLGTKLEDGDLIHIGKLEFRFNLHGSEYSRKPTITKLDS